MVYANRGDTLTAKKSMVLSAPKGRGDVVKIKKSQRLMVGAVFTYSETVIAFSKGGDVVIPMSKLRHFQVGYELGVKKWTAEEVSNG